MPSLHKKNEIAVITSRPPITALVFEGGGIKGLVYAGALAALEEKKLLGELKWVAGSSAGAMTALMVALGYTQNQIMEELKAINFTQFKDHAPSSFGIIGRTICGVKNIFGIKRGYYRGKKLHDWVKKIVKEGLEKENATFEDLHKKAQHNPKFKDLFVTATNINDQKTTFFSFIAHGKAPIADIILASMSIPCFFQARYLDANYNIDWNPTRKKVKAGILTPYVDGGVLDNDPIEVFQNRRYWSPGYFKQVQGEAINPSVLNVRVDSKKEIADLWGKSNNQIITFFSWLKSLFMVTLSDKNKLNKYRYMTIFIPDGDISTTEFNLTAEQKGKLLHLGNKTTLTYVDNVINEAGYSYQLYKDVVDLKKSYEELVQQLKEFVNLDEEEREYMLLLKEGMERAGCVINSDKKVVQIDKSKELFISSFQSRYVY